MSIYILLVTFNLIYLIVFYSDCHYKHTHTYMFIYICVCVHTYMPNLAILLNII